MPAPHAFYSMMLAERTASRNVFVLFYFIYLFNSYWAHTKERGFWPITALYFHLLIKTREFRQTTSVN